MFLRPATLEIQALALVVLVFRFFISVFFLNPIFSIGRPYVLASGLPKGVVIWIELIRPIVYVALSPHTAILVEIVDELPREFLDCLR